MFNVSHFHENKSEIKLSELILNIIKTYVIVLEVVLCITIVQKLTSDNEFLARIFDCWGAGKMFSIL